MAALARGEVPTIEVALELDPHGRFRAGSQPVALLEAQRSARAAALAEARRRAEPETVYRIAIELAALSRAAGGSREAAMAALDRALAGAVLTIDLAASARSARAAIGAGALDDHDEGEDELDERGEDEVDERGDGELSADAETETETETEATRPPPPGP
jgi:hypothetical protein